MWKKNSIKIIGLFILVLCLMLFSACATRPIENFYISKVEEIHLSLEEAYTFNTDEELYSTDINVFSIEDNVGKAKSVGECFIKNSETGVFLYKIIVDLSPAYISLKGDNWIKTNTVCNLEVRVSPVGASQEVSFESSDSSIITINDKGEYRSNDKEGFVTITVRSKVDESVYSEYNVLVEDKDEENYQSLIENIYKNNDNVVLDANDTNSLLNLFMENAKNSLVGVEKYTKTNNKVSMSDFGSGVIYRRDAILSDGSVIENTNDTSEIKNISGFKYYVITTRFLTKDAYDIKVYLGEEYGSVEANLIQYDDKIDLAVITFNSRMYFSCVKFGDSDKVMQGEFIISVGNSYGKDYYRTANVGIISSTKRYISTDTDGDNTSDWDSEYLQHDAAINDGDNGGMVINLKGELIGINDTKISSTIIAYNCMSLCIPSNLVKDIVSMLEDGIKPDRPILGVTIIDVRNYYKNESYFQANYPETKNIPEGLEYGFYISEVNNGGVAYLAGVKVGDVLLEFNGINTKYSYMLRSELGKFMYGSGQKAELKILRNGEEITLEVVF